MRAFSSRLPLTLDLDLDLNLDLRRPSPAAPDASAALQAAILRSRKSSCRYDRGMDRSATGRGGVVGLIRGMVLRAGA